MRHALMIDSAVAGAKLNRLIQLGIRSFDHSWTVDEALAAARRRTPDVIIASEAPGARLALNATLELLMSRTSNGRDRGSAGGVTVGSATTPAFVLPERYLEALLGNLEDCAPSTKRLPALAHAGLPDTPS